MHKQGNVSPKAVTLGEDLIETAVTQPPERTRSLRQTDGWAARLNRVRRLLTECPITAILSISSRSAGVLITAAGLPALSIHGLCHSFGTLAEWVECPAGVAVQIMGYKPSATAEKHYRVRPLDLLRSWHVKIYAWILEQAGIEFVPVQAGLHVVTA